MVRAIQATMVCVALLATMNGRVQADTIVYWAGGSSFNDSTQAFTGFTADSLTAIDNGQFDAYWHNHGGAPPLNLQLDIELDNSWTTIWSTTTNDSLNHLLTEIPTTLSFSLGTVTGLRFLSDPNQNQTFHGFSNFGTYGSNATDFTFATSEVPTPSSFAALIGMGLMGLVAVRRRRKK